MGPGSRAVTNSSLRDANAASNTRTSARQGSDLASLVASHPTLRLLQRLLSSAPPSMARRLISRLLAEPAAASPDLPSPSPPTPPPPTLLSSDPASDLPPALLSEAFYAALVAANMVAASLPSPPAAAGASADEAGAVELLLPPKDGASSAAAAAPPRCNLRIEITRQASGGCNCRVRGVCVKGTPPDFDLSGVVTASSGRSPGQIVFNSAWYNLQNHKSMKSEGGT